MWFPSPKIQQTLYYSAFLIAAAGIHISPALASIGVIIMIVMGFFSLSGEAQERRIIRLQMAFGGLAVFLFAMDCVSGTSPSKAWSALQVMLPWFFLPVIMKGAQKLTVRPDVIFLVLAIPLCWIAGASLLNYLRDFDFLSQMVLESKPLPLYTDVYHIEFSLLITVVLLGMTFYFPQIKNSPYKIHLYVVYALLFLALHMISARTGLLGYWLGISIWVWSLLKSKDSLRKVNPWVAIGSVLAVLVLLVQIPSLKNRIVNTGEDLNALFNGGNLNHKSIGQRVEAWKATGGIIKESHNFWTGVGTAQFDAQLQESYERQKTSLFVSNRIGPHNQILQWMATYGVFAAIAWFALIIALLLHQLGPVAALMIGLPLWAASIFESIAQRQAGTLAVVIGLVVFQLVQHQRENIKKISPIN